MENINSKVGFSDIDTSIVKFFESMNLKIIRPDNSIFNVKTVFCTKERWAKVKKDGGLIDEKGTLITPIIAIKRDNTNLTNNLYGLAQNPRNYKIQYIVDDYNKSSIINKIIVDAARNGNYGNKLNMPLNRRYKIYKVIVPKFIKIEYSINILSSYMTHVNEIIEQIIDKKNYMQDILKIPLYGKEDAFITARYRELMSDNSNYEFNNNDFRDIIYTLGLDVNGYIISKFNELANSNLIEVVDSAQNLIIDFNEK